jgi:prepilin-type N-terminal cleavage/methylation domain-containing protein
MKTSLNNRGFSLIEMLVYLSVLAIILIVIINIVLSYTTSYRTLSVNRIIEHSAMNAMERMTRDIRAANSIDSANSTFGTNPGVLTIISTHSGFSTTTKFYVSSNKLNIDVNSSFLGPLTASNVVVSNLTFTLLTGSTTNAIKIDMTVDASNGTVSKSRTYHSTIVLKES